MSDFWSSARKVPASNNSNSSNSKKMRITSNKKNKTHGLTKTWRTTRKGLSSEGLLIFRKHSAHSHSGSAFIPKTPDRKKPPDIFDILSPFSENKLTREKSYHNPESKKSIYTKCRLNINKKLVTSAINEENCQSLEINESIECTDDCEAIPSSLEHREGNGDVGEKENMKSGYCQDQNFRQLPASPLSRIDTNIPISSPLNAIKQNGFKRKLFKNSSLETSALAETLPCSDSGESRTDEYCTPHFALLNLKKLLGDSYIGGINNNKNTSPIHRRQIKNRINYWELETTPNEGSLLSEKYGINFQLLPESELSKSRKNQHSIIHETQSPLKEINSPEASKTASGNHDQVLNVKPTKDEVNLLKVNHDYSLSNQTYGEMQQVSQVEFNYQKSPSLFEKQLTNDGIGISLKRNREISEDTGRDTSGSENIHEEVISQRLSNRTPENKRKRYSEPIFGTNIDKRRHVDSQNSSNSFIGDDSLLPCYIGNTESQFFSQKRVCKLTRSHSSRPLINPNEAKSSSRLNKSLEDVVLQRKIFCDKTRRQVTDVDKVKGLNDFELENRITFLTSESESKLNDCIDNTEQLRLSQTKLSVISKPSEVFDISLSVCPIKTTECVHMNKQEDAVRFENMGKLNYDDELMRHYDVFKIALNHESQLDECIDNTEQLILPLKKIHEVLKQPVNNNSTPVNVLLRNANQPEIESGLENMKKINNNDELIMRLDDVLKIAVNHESQLDDCIEDTAPLILPHKKILEVLKQSDAPGNDSSTPVDMLHRNANQQGIVLEMENMEKTNYDHESVMIWQDDVFKKTVVDEPQLEDCIEDTEPHIFAQKKIHEHISIKVNNCTSTNKSFANISQQSDTLLEKEKPDCAIKIRLLEHVLKQTVEHGSESDDCIENTEPLNSYQRNCLKLSNSTYASHKAIVDYSIEIDCFATTNNLVKNVQDENVSFSTFVDLEKRDSENNLVAQDSQLYDCIENTEPIVVPLRTLNAPPESTDASRGILRQCSSAHLEESPELIPSQVDNVIMNVFENDERPSKANLDISACPARNERKTLPSPIGTQHIEEYSTELLVDEIIDTPVDTSLIRSDSIVSGSSCSSSKLPPLQALAEYAKQRKAPLKKGSLAAQLVRVIENMEAERRIFKYEREKTGLPPSGGKVFRVLHVWGAAPFRVLGFNYKNEKVLIILDDGALNSDAELKPGCVIRIYPPWETLTSAEHETYVAITSCDIFDGSTFPALPGSRTLYEEVPLDPFFRNSRKFFNALFNNRQ